MQSADAGRPTIRPQYHLRPTAGGIDAFDVRRLITLSQHLPVRMIDPEHLRLVLAADLRYPIILDQDGRLMDGMHRVGKALLEGVREIPAVRFIEDPQPDFVNCDPDLLPYHD